MKDKKKFRRMKQNQWLLLQELNYEFAEEFIEYKENFDEETIHDYQIIYNSTPLIPKRGDN